MRLSKLALCIASVSMPLMAAEIKVIDSSDNQIPITTLDAVTVTATRTAKSALNSAQAVNVITQQQIARVLASTVFDSLINVPNVTSTGGPRSGGQKFSVRGFSDAEDVLISVDGAIQTFEKYRMGSFFSDPELYRSVSIKRGPSTVLHGGGALGGVVEMELKDASDFLAPNEKAGAKIKLGHHGNNNEKNGAVYAYARPTESLDVVAAYVKRSSDDFELSNGKTLDNSAIEAESLLLKGEYYLNEDSLIGLSYTKSEDSQRTEFNTTDPGAWGTVYRTIEQSVTNLSYELNPAHNPYVNLNARFGYSQSQVTESDGLGTLKDFIGIASNYEYNIATLDIANTSVFNKHALTYGIQYSDKERIGTKLSYPCLNLNRQTYQCVEYANNAVQAEITSQPGGTQKRLGVYIQDEFTWQDLTLTGGLRFEKYKTTATSGFNQIFNNLDTQAEHSQVVPAVTANYQINKMFAIFASYQEGFRAPLIDELYDQYSGRNPALGLEIENSTNKEVGMSYQTTNVLTSRDALTARFIYFDIDVNDEIQSNTNSATNPAPAPRYSNIGDNQRDGIEFEVNYAHTLGYANFSYSRISGENENNEPLWYLPADKLALSVGLHFFDDTIKTGLRIQNVDKRTVLINGVEQQHKDYTLIGMNASWDINKSWSARVAIDNLFDKEYQVIAGTGGGIGEYGIGRNIKTQISFKF
ncbi:TonB-dependent receptor [Pseudoalteromonas sp. SG45-5]|uniref:TonB-dependent receptor domain-containing protein n=1 Tax=unclassified Pseudoalteromonas TaxID=194690 RepID=UPI0015FBE8E8|nr:MULTISPECIES: TonB-dependent receptor [unclassified Pseudoalteromonas]MBB1385861.1 TonB-dependent receptor [Pseudoalteromonas sp. SG45-5]MBB1393729.1 TonB-dependent receptor [Pseudoalteromonas sp. SG44-4]MBB1446539.1 TonB-dependent receptor [Pseudoalteromonas sp. SG41-6]